MLQVPPQSGTGQIQPVGQKRRQGKTEAVILAHYSLSSRRFSPHFWPLDSQSCFYLSRRDLKINIGWALTCLADYQSLFYRFSQAVLCTAKDSVAKVQPTGQAICLKPGWWCFWHKWLKSSGLTKHVDLMTRQPSEQSLFIFSFADFIGVTFPFWLILSTVNRIEDIKQNTFISLDLIADLTSLLLEISQMKNWLHFPLQKEIPSR